MKINEQLNILNDTIQQANDMLINAQKSIDIVMEGMMKNATDEQIKSIQEQTKQIKLLLNKAKKGENVDTEISNMTKIIKDGGRDIK